MEQSTKDGVWEQSFPNPSVINGKQVDGWCNACNQATKEIQKQQNKTDIVTFCDKHKRS